MAKNGNKVEPIPGQKPMLDVIAAKYGEPLQDISIPITDAAIKKLVGGSYETETLYDASKNVVFGALLRGKEGITVCGVGGNDNTALTSLHPYWTQKFKRDLSPAQRAEPKAETLLGEIAEAKTLAGNRDTSDKTAPNKTKETR